MNQFNQTNSDGSDPDEGFYGWVQDMIYAAVSICIAVFLGAAVAGFACGLRVVGWI